VRLTGDADGLACDAAWSGHGLYQSGFTSCWPYEAVVNRKILAKVIPNSMRSVFMRIASKLLNLVEIVFVPELAPHN
jgi:hypothetical protein